jgi:hypothetical protein
MADLSKLADDLSRLTVLEAAELARLLEEKWQSPQARQSKVSFAAIGCRGRDRLGSFLEAKLNFVHGFEAPLFSYFAVTSCGNRPRGQKPHLQIGRG